MRFKFSLRSVLLTIMMIAAPVASSAAIIFSIGIAPPALPVYEQPLCPGEGYIWTPGYWAYGDDGYFWVPGTWIEPPEVGFLWTPGYWGWGEGLYVFHRGYWGLHVGFYGGINYGFGYVGFGYEGGYWNNGAFFYNRSVNNVRNVTNVYNKTVVNNTTINRVSYNGGEGGITAQPTAEQQAAAQERHIEPTAAQTQHMQTASTNRQLYESVNHGKPPIAATPKPGEFNGQGVVSARSAAPSYRPANARPGGTGAARQNEPAGTARPNENAQRPQTPGANEANQRPANAVHAKDLPPLERPTAPNSGNAKQDQRIQQQQEKVYAQQQKERQQLQQRQEQEDQRLAQQHANDAAKQKVEQRHQQQTNQMVQKHQQQQQKVQQRMPAPNRKKQN